MDSRARSLPGDHGDEIQPANQRYCVRSHGRDAVGGDAGPNWQGSQRCGSGCGPRVERVRRSSIVDLPSKRVGRRGQTVLAPELVALKGHQSISTGSRLPPPSTWQKRSRTDLRLVRVLCLVHAQNLETPWEEGGR
jgi:hypothetical protein